MATQKQWIETLVKLAQEERAEHPLETLMADDPKKTGQDRKRIALSEPHEVRSWTESLGVDEKTLRAAVAAVGDSAEKVREYLRKQ